MMQFFNRSISRKLVLLITGISSLAVLIACVGLGTYQWHHARQTLFEQEATAAQITADSSAAALLFGDGATATEILGTLRTDPRILAACLWDKNGTSAGVYRSSSLASSRPCPSRPPSSASFTLHRFTILQPVTLKGSHVGLLYFDVSLAELNHLTVSLAETAFMAALCASFFALLLSTITERWISRPIVELTRTTVEIAEGGSRLVRATLTSDDEVGILVRQFNTMLDRLHEREAELQGAHDELESKVLERTKDLQDEIAERKLIEIALHHAKNLAEQANRAKSSFLANMSHELRTPLNAIIGYSEMLWEDAQAPSQAAMREDLSKILYSARHLLNLISDVLDLSKIEAGHMKVTLEEVSVNEVIAEVLPIAEVLVRANENRLLVSNLAQGATCSVDTLRFRQCLLNLLSNAAKFTKQGTITLEAVLAERSDRAGDSARRWVVWNIIDTGIGLSAESLPKLFQNFSQVDGSASRQHGGTGLGLAISQELCKAMGGSIEVQSELGVGSTFQIWLPLCEVASSFPEEGSHSSSNAPLPALETAAAIALSAHVRHDA